MWYDMLCLVRISTIRVGEFELTRAIVSYDSCARYKAILSTGASVGRLFVSTVINLAV
jgi:hypothetical protein